VRRRAEAVRKGHSDGLLVALTGEGIAHAVLDSEREQ
jgi:hypothetical protein